MAKKKSNQLAHIKASLNKQPYNPAMLKKLIDFYLNKKSFNDANKSLKNYAKTYHNDPILYFLEGKLLFKTNNIEQAQLKFKQATTLLEQPEIKYDNVLQKDIYCDIAYTYYTSAPHLAFYFYDKGAQLAPLSSEQKKLCIRIVDGFIRLIDHNWQLCFYDNQCVFHLAQLREEETLNIIQYFENLPYIAEDQEYVFCQYFIKKYNELLDIAKKPEQYSANIKLLEIDKLKTFYYKYPELWQSICDKWCEKIYLIITDKKFNTLDINILKLPMIFKNYGWEIKNKHVLSKTLELFSSKIPLENSFEYDVYCVMYMLINMLYTTPFEAIKAFNAQFLNQEKNYIQLAFYLPLLKILYDENYYNGLEDELILLLQKIASTWQNDRNRYIETYCHTLNILFLLKFTIQSSRGWNKLIFENIVSPLLIHYIEEKNFEVAHSLAICTDLSYGQQPVTLSQHKLCWFTYINEVILAAKSYTAEINYTLPQKRIMSHTESTNIAFLIDFKFNYCSPIKVVYNVLTSLSVTHPNNFKITLYAFDGVENTPEVQNLVLSLKKLPFKNKINIVDFLSIRKCSINRDKFIERFSLLHTLIAKEKIDILYYVHSSLFLITFAATFQLAPKQILWSMGGGYNYHLPELDGYLTNTFMAPGYRTICEYQWYSFPTIHLEKLDIEQKHLTAAIQLKKQKFSQYSILIGCMTRASKLDNDDFLNALEIILKRNPSVAFLWFHPVELTSLTQKMQERGILKQCLYQGWVSTQVYAQLLDIHIESFPYPTGLVITDAMLAKTPCVFMHTPDNPLHLHSTIHDIISKKLEFSEQNKLINIFSSKKTADLFLYAYNQNEYVEYIQKLIDSEKLRSSVGIAGKNFVQNFMYNPLTVGEEFAKYTRKILG